MSLAIASQTTARRLAEPALDQLRAAVRGAVHTPDTPDWDRARAPWALAVTQHPLAVVEVADAHDVQAAVRWAVEHRIEVTAQPVGHGASDALEGVLLLRTRALNAISVDTAAGMATVGAGAKSGELLAALDGSGLTFLAGSNPDPSVVGMTIGGGMSWFGRAYGLGANSIVAATLVDGFGRMIEVSAEEHPDLFWAIRGGGGDFGILTSLTLALHPAPHVFGGRLMWPIEQMPAVLRAFAQVSRSAPDALTLWYHTYQFPPMPEVPEPMRGRAFAGVALAYLGERDDAEPWLAPFRDIADLAFDLLGDVALRDLGTIAAEPVDPMPSLEYSTFLTDLGDATRATLTRLTGAGSGSPLAILQIRHLGGALAETAPEHGAVGHLDEPYLLFAMGVPAAPGLAEAIATTFDGLRAGLVGHTNHRTVANFLGPRGDLGRVWSPATRSRLARIKASTDPLSTIRSNRPVQARAAEARAAQIKENSDVR